MRLRTYPRRRYIVCYTNSPCPPSLHAETSDQVNKELGERRQADRGPASIAFGEEVAPAAGQEKMDKDEFVTIMEERVKEEYAKLDNYHSLEQQ